MKAHIPENRINIDLTHDDVDLIELALETQIAYPVEIDGVEPELAQVMREGAKPVLKLIQNRQPFSEKDHGFIVYKAIKYLSFYCSDVMCQRAPGEEQLEAARLTADACRQVLARHFSFWERQK